MTRPLAWTFSLALAATVLTATPFLTQSFELGKHFSYGVGIILTLGLFYYQSFKNRRLELRWSYVDLFPVAFLLLVNVSAMFAVSPFVARNGSYGHFLGAIFFGAAFLTYFLAKQVFARDEAVAILLKTLNYALLAVSLYAISQFLGFDPLVYGSEDLAVHGAFATFTDPSRLAGFLVLTLPISFVLYLYRRKELFNIYLFTWLCGVAALGLTSSIAGWLSWSIITILIVGVAAMKGKADRSKLAIALLGAVLVLMGAIGLLVGGSDPGKTTFASTVKNVKAQTIRAYTENSLVLEITYLSLDDRPWTGYGPDSFIYAFYKNETPANVEHFKGEQKFDNAHNYFLQLIVTLGWPAGVLFTILITLLFFLSLNKIWTSCDEAVACYFDLAILGAFLSYIAYLKFSVEDYASLLVLWTLLGVISVRSTKVRTFSREIFSPVIDLKQGVVYIGMLLLAVGVFQGFIERGTYISADRAFKQAVGGSLAPGSQAERSAYRRASTSFATNPNPYYLYAEGRYLNKLALDTGSADVNLEATQVLEKAVLLDPLEVEYRLLLANSYSDQAVTTEGPSRDVWVKKADQQYREVIAGSPNFRTAHVSYGLLLISERQYVSAINELQTANELDPTDLPTHYFLGLAYEGSGDKSAAIESYKRALKDPQFGDEAGLAIEELGGSSTASQANRTDIQH